MARMKPTLSKLLRSSARPTEVFSRHLNTNSNQINLTIPNLKKIVHKFCITYSLSLCLPVSADLIMEPTQQFISAFRRSLSLFAVKAAQALRFFNLV